MCKMHKNLVFQTDDDLNVSRYMDFISVICYDYHFSYESSVNHHAPLYSLEQDTNYDANINIVSESNRIKINVLYLFLIYYIIL